MVGTQSHLLSVFKSGSAPTWLNLIHQPSHVSGGGGGKGYYSRFPPGDFPVEDAGGPVKRIQTLFISQNYVSPLWLCTKSK